MLQTALSRRRFLAGAGLAALGLQNRGLVAQMASLAPITVRTAAGLLRGEQSQGVNVFRGIPFAEPPVGPLRFRPPVPARAWTGERDATRFGAAPVQPGPPTVPHSEDCLTLNLWAPQGKGPFPVYVWIHGGGFTGGRATDPMFDGTALAQEGIVCITAAYRLGVFGFLDVEPLLGPSYAGSANNAVRDLVLALEWVRKNVADFGGDPARVTVGGESAGAKLTDILLGVPSAQALFHQGISESGGAERVWAREQSAVVGRGFGELWRTQTGNPVSAVAAAEPAALIDVQSAFMKQWPQHFPLRAEVDGVLIPRKPVETIAAGSGAGRRLLIGTNREESAAFLGPHPDHDPGPGDLGNIPVDRFAPVLARYKDIYPQMTDEVRRIRAATAEEYWVPSERVAEAMLKAGGKVFMYRMDFFETTGPMRGYAFHALDTRLVWNRPSMAAGNGAVEAALAHQMSSAWMAFIRGEAPAAAGMPAWPEFRLDTRSTMILDAPNHVDQQPQEAELRLWDGIL